MDGFEAHVETLDGSATKLGGFDLDGVDGVMMGGDDNDEERFVDDDDVKLIGEADGDEVLLSDVDKMGLLNSVALTGGFVSADGVVIGRAKDDEEKAEWLVDPDVAVTSGLTLSDVDEERLVDGPVAATGGLVEADGVDGVVIEGDKDDDERLVDGDVVLVTREADGDEVLLSDVDKESVAMAVEAAGDEVPLSDDEEPLVNGGLAVEADAVDGVVVGGKAGSKILVLKLV